MVKTIFGKKGKSLIFPVHCRAYVGIDYGDFFSSVNDDSDTYGIYSLKDESFTLEAYITWPSQKCLLVCLLPLQL